MRITTISVAALGALAAAWSAPAPAPVVPLFADAFGLRRRLSRPGIALTFDDGPHPHGTPAVLELLDRAGAVATFYLVGEQVEKDPGLAAEVAAAGHEIALHCFAHTLLLRRSPRALEDDLGRALAAIESATGKVPTSYRPPYGVFSAAAVALCRRRGWEPTLWSRWGRDWGARETTAAIARRASAGLVPQDIVLLHDADHYSAPDSWRRTVAALPQILAAAGEVGVPFVPVTPGATSG